MTTEPFLLPFGDPAPRRGGQDVATRYVRGAQSFCSTCSRDLPLSRRCTTDMEALWNATDRELATGEVAGCVLDRDDELERRARERRYEARPTTTMPRRQGLLARLAGMRGSR